VVDGSSVIQVTLTELRLTFEIRTFEICGGAASGVLRILVTVYLHPAV
jgi:hypothetical protein